LNII
jgi:hypothetical protein